MIIFLTFLNTRGVKLGKWIQNIFTSAKMLSLLGLILICVFVARNASAIADNFTHLWAVRGAQTIEPGVGFLRRFLPTVTAGSGWYGMLVALAVAQVGSLFSADAWNNIGFYLAAEVKNPKRDVALSMAFGTVIVITLYCLANLAYLCALPLAHQIQSAPDDRVATAALVRGVRSQGRVDDGDCHHYFHTFGCNNGLILAGSRVAYAMAKDELFFRATGKLNQRGVPGVALVYQGIWIVVLILLRTRTPGGGLIREPLQQPAQLCGVRRVAVLRADDCGNFCFAAMRRPDVAEAVQSIRVSDRAAVVYSGGEQESWCVLLLYRNTDGRQRAWWIVLLGLPVYWLVGATEARKTERRVTEEFQRINQRESTREGGVAWATPCLQRSRSTRS